MEKFSETVPPRRHGMRASHRPRRWVVTRPDAGEALRETATTLRETVE
jgi:hypothetical protein